MKRMFSKVSLETFEKSFPNLPKEIVSRIYENIKLPVRKTKLSAGYDIASPIDFILEPGDSFIIPTGIKAYMENNEFLGIYIRSSFGIKKDIILKNGVGIIDADYVDNSSNEGHICVAIKNCGILPLEVKQGEACAQAIFQSYYTTLDDTSDSLRTGGIGSTDVTIKKAKLIDAKTLLNLQRQAFEKYSLKYGKFDADPCKMTLHRMEFNIKYRLGDYQKIMFGDEIIGGIFGFMLEEETTWKIGQLYLKPEYSSHGYGSIAFSKFLEQHPEVQIWYADTIKQEENNLKFYQKFDFDIIDEEEEHEGMSFVTLIKKVGNNR